MQTITAHAGLTLPVLGLGTYRLNGSAGVDAMAAAIDGGWTLLDSAVGYENEGAVGRAVRASGRDRDELIVTSKLPGRHHAHDEALAAVEESLYRTGLDVLDLYLVHWPNPSVDRYVEAWGALMEARDRGLVKAIGVCNFEIEHLDRLQAETGELPQVNQIELHPYFPQADLLAHGLEHGILTEAWTPLGRGNDLLENPVLTEVAAAHGATTAQVALAWSVGRGAIPLPKAASPARQAENLAAADLVLTDDEIARITALGRPDGRTYDQDPTRYEEF